MHAASIVRLLSIAAVLACGGTGLAAGRYVAISYGTSDRAGELTLGVTYTLWLPETAGRIRGIIVHQHGCGTGACQGGATAAYDLQWQALAAKWNCALLGPSYHQAEKQNCRLWCDPRNGSGKRFLQAIDDLADMSRHPELKQVPWCLWGHSGGGFWASLMQTMHPERIVAVWFRSGTAFQTWEKGEIDKPEISAAVYEIPMMCNPGAKEQGDKRFNGAWTGAIAMFKAYRAKGAPIGVAPDPSTAHECGDSRYLAIPFFDACLAMRLPAKESADQRLRPVDRAQAWSARLLSDKAQPVSAASGESPAKDGPADVWLPNARVAHAWVEYVSTGDVSDTTPPPAPSRVRVAANSDQGVEITWDAAADLESGIQAFVIERDGKELAQVPAKPIGKFGRPLFQTMSYHDTPTKPLPVMRYVDTSVGLRGEHVYRVMTVNSVGLRSKPSPAAALHATHEIKQGTADGS